MKQSFERTFTAILTIAVLAMAGILVRREILKAQAEGGPPLAPPTFVPGWASLIGSGNTIGNPWAPVQVIEFGDLQCPACRGYQRVLERIVDEFEGKVAVVYLHYPLPYHKEALPAARAAECAGNQGRLAEFISLSYERQDSLGIKPYTELGREAGVKDGAGFKACLSNPTTDSVIAAEKRLGEKIGVDGTPTIIVNGWRYKGSPKEKQLVELIRSVLSGKAPGTIDAARSGVDVASDSTKTQ